MPYTLSKKFLIVICLAGVFSYPGLAIDLTKVDFSYQYDKGPIKVSHRIANLADQYRLSLMFKLRKIKVEDHVENLRIFSQIAYSDKVEQPLDIKLIAKDSSKIQVLMDLQFDAGGMQNYIVIAFDFLQVQYYYTIEINSALKFPLSDILIRRDGSIDNLLIKKNDSVSFSALSGNSNFIAFLYPDNFPAASPPMSKFPNSSTEKLVIEQMVVNGSAMMIAKENYLYFIQNDSSSNKGISFLARSKGYPKFRTVESLMEPLIYICTINEYKKLQTAEDKKQAFNDFWVKLLKNKNLASKSIQLYYRSVKKANTYFSNHKAGWKTDQGMMYIVFGPPDEVKRKEDQEIWSYTTFEGDIKFTFDKKPNLFVQHHYQLERKKSLNKQWFSAVQKWRRGNI